MLPRRLGRFSSPAKHIWAVAPSRLVQADKIYPLASNVECTVRAIGLRRLQTDFPMSDLSLRSGGWERAGGHARLPPPGTVKLFPKPNTFFLRLNVTKHHQCFVPNFTRGPFQRGDSTNWLKLTFEMNSSHQKEGRGSQNGWRTRTDTHPLHTLKQNGGGCQDSART